MHISDLYNWTLVRVDFGRECCARLIITFLEEKDPDALSDSLVKEKCNLLI